MPSEKPTKSKSGPDATAAKDTAPQDTQEHPTTKGENNEAVTGGRKSATEQPAAETAKVDQQKVPKESSESTAEQESDPDKPETDQQEAIQTEKNSTEATNKGGELSTHEQQTAPVANTPPDSDRGNSKAAPLPRSPSPPAIPQPPKLPRVSCAMEWTPNELDSTTLSCPDGGPGGLVCCSACETAYSRYLSQTSRDMDVQLTHSLGLQAEELLRCIEEKRIELMAARQSAELKPLPASALPLEKTPTRGAAGTRGGGSSSKDSAEETLLEMEWNITSTLDMEEVRGSSRI